MYLLTSASNPSRVLRIVYNVRHLMALVICTVASLHQACMFGVYISIVGLIGAIAICKACTYLRMKFSKCIGSIDVVTYNTFIAASSVKYHSICR